MKYIEGQNRTQINLFPITLEDSIDQDNDARLVDLFVSALNISDLGFKVDHIENGRPAYHPKDLLRIYIYGYMNSIRSSRNLEKECKRNLEMIWLVKGLVPDHNTISNQYSEYQRVIENNKIRIAQNKDYYQQRQAVVEHPYGTIKRQ